MSAPSELVEMILDLLAPWGGVTARRLFSGFGLYRDGIIFAIVIRDTFYLKVDERDRDAFVARGAARFTYDRKRRTVAMTGYYEAPPELFDDSEEMIRWCRRALDAALRIRQSKAPRRKVQAK